MRVGVPLPQRYDEPWRQPFYDRVSDVIGLGSSVLDVGSGRTPAIPPELRPAHCRYVGLDIAEAELALAPPGSYEETITTDIVHVPEPLQEQFDLVVCWQVLEHVRSLKDALSAMYRLLRPGGHLAAMVSARWAYFAVANRLVPREIGLRFMHSRLGRRRDTVFPAYYDRSTMRGIHACLAGWSRVEVLPRYRGASYLTGLPTLQRLYVAYENWASRGHPSLATHYLVFAEK
jgi:SAM-dependent methyltransferase